jgi:glyoxylase-like metal-dependent hydrolase (beta-lactamase superfamily II)
MGQEEALMIIPIQLSISNAYLIKGERPILIDTGCPGDHATLIRVLTKEGIAASDLALILHTHGHRDHAGGTRQLKQMTSAPTAVHSADADMLRNGANRRLIPTSFTGRLIRPVVDKPFPAVEPDVRLDDGMDLKPYGIAGRVITTPGHTNGSVSILLENGQAVAGDLLVGGYLGGLLARHHPGYPYFAEDMAVLRLSIKKLMAYSPIKLYVGHGGPLKAQAVAELFP